MQISLGCTQKLKIGKSDFSLYQSKIMTILGQQIKKTPNPKTLNLSKSMQINLKKNPKHVEIRAADYFLFLSYE